MPFSCISQNPNLITFPSLTNVAQLVGHHSTNRNVAAWIPGQGICLGCEWCPGLGLFPGHGTCRRHAIDVSLLHRCFSPSVFLPPFPSL